MAPLNINLAPLGGSRYLTVCQTKTAPFVFVGKLGPPQPRRARHFRTLQEVAEQWQPFKCKKCQFLKNFQICQFQYVVSSTSINSINSNKTHENKPFHGWLFHGKIPWKIHRFLPNIGGFVAPCFTWIAVSCFLRLRSFTQGVFFLPLFSAGKKKTSPRPSRHWKLQQTFDRCCFFKKKCGGWFRHGLIFFWKALISGKEPFLGAVFISKNQWDPMATSSWSFDPATSWGQLQ